ncbi:MAG: septum site-determining protein MinC [Gammaproteobacteria bacterium]|nr:septum site-determining protein MinC [Gammaproteobacteria bacterium]
MSDSNLVMDRRSCFRFKTSFSPCTILQLARYDLEELSKQVSTAVNRAPNFFIGSPVILDLEEVRTLGVLDFNRIKQILIANNLVPVGVRGGDVEQHAAAVDAGFPVVTIGKAKQSDEPIKKSVQVSQTKLVTTPIRSGMQVYAKDADLIVIAPVSPGAELLADGNIHVYGPLRGRALAGVQGNTQARIFCRTLEAELVAIAGYYLVKEDMQNLPSHDSMVQVYLENEQVRIAAM